LKNIALGGGSLRPPMKRGSLRHPLPRQHIDPSAVFLGRQGIVHALLPDRKKLLAAVVKSPLGGSLKVGSATMRVPVLPGARLGSPLRRIMRLRIACLIVAALGTSRPRVRA
jgi:hypothetical protein